MNIESTNINPTKEIKNTKSQNNNETSTKFTEELKALETSDKVITEEATQKKSRTSHTRTQNNSSNNKKYLYST